MDGYLMKYGRHTATFRLDGEISMSFPGLAFDFNVILAGLDHFINVKNRLRGREYVIRENKNLHTIGRLLPTRAT